MPDASYRKAAINHLNLALHFNSDFMALVTRWRADKELQMTVSQIQDLFTSSESDIKGLVTVRGGSETVYSVLSRKIPDLHVEDVRMAIITALILYYMRSEA